MNDLRPLDEQIVITCSLEQLRAVLHDWQDDQCDHTMPDKYPPERPGYERDCRALAEHIARALGS
jgi:hypothetical protein